MDWITEQLEFSPKAGDVIHHYCSAETFLSILTHRTIRLSDIQCMNDRGERIWGREIIGQVALAVSAGKAYAADFVRGLAAAIDFWQINSIAAAACFSLHPDSLGQWRGYAEDGSGFSIGFDACAMTAVDRLSSVHCVYDPEDIRKKIEFSVNAIYQRFAGNLARSGCQWADGTEVLDLGSEVKESAGAYAMPWHDRDTMFLCVSLTRALESFKHPAFEQEGEIRLTHIVHRVESGAGFRLESANKKMTEPKIQFRLRNGVPAPFLDFPLPGNDERGHPIRDVILGPKNPASPEQISVMLETMRFPDVRVRRSSAPYC
ncbi:DUF2971 domain-containing protein [Stenotrophomonas sp.]|uniref:DUF2971 domain-containing protein n=1 Tax=Stenotrophomonas sp. TaxID=69392 RepID=UPI000374ED9B|nr:DUF2971 domain-containing protein [Stenotrophomonas sp.]